MSEQVEAHISKRFEIKKRIGKGAYGIVWRAYDKKLNKNVALKKIFDAFQNQTDSQRTFREIEILRQVDKHDNIISLWDVVTGVNYSNDIYLVFEFMETDLHKIIQRGNILKGVHNCYIMYQILKAIKYLHSGNIIHRDLKPSNILVDTNCTTKLCDFGLARSLASHESDEFDPTMTEYVATRWYRSPEILLGSKKYTKGVDIWSIGCILGEIIYGKPIFPGTCSLNQVQIILQSLPRITHEDINAIDSQYSYSLLVETLSRSRKVDSLQDRFKEVDKNALNMIEKLLIFNPEKRISAATALEMEYVEMFHEPEKEITLTKDVELNFNDNVKLDVKKYQNKIFKMFPNKTDSTLSKPEAQKSLNKPKILNVNEVKSTGIYYPRDRCSKNQINQSNARKASLNKPQMPEQRQNRPLSRNYKRPEFGSQETKVTKKPTPNQDYATISEKALNELKGKFNI